MLHITGNQIRYPARPETRRPLRVSFSMSATIRSIAPSLAQALGYDCSCEYYYCQGGKDHAQPSDHLAHQLSGVSGAQTCNLCWNGEDRLVTFAQASLVCASGTKAGLFNPSNRSCKASYANWSNILSHVQARRISRGRS